MILNKKETLKRFVEELFFESPRSREAGALLNWLASLPAKPIVLGGDFNSFCLSGTIREITASFRDTAWLTPACFRASHKSLGFKVPVKGDYIFVSKELHSAGTKIVPRSPGDHFPVVTNVF